MTRNKVPAWGDQHRPGRRAFRARRRREPALRSPPGLDSTPPERRDPERS